MSETAATPEKPAWRLWTRKGFRDDSWFHAEDVAAGADSNSGLILPLAVVVDLDASQRAALAGRLGVIVQPGEGLDALVPLLPGISLVALAFPAFNDGRSFSKAELLRRAHGFAGTLRASGDVLIDQIPHMLRLGFTEFEVSNPTALKRLAEHRIGGIPWRYQPAAVDEGEAVEYSWRRLARA